MVIWKCLKISVVGLKLPHFEDGGGGGGASFSWVEINLDTEIQIHRLPGRALEFLLIGLKLHRPGGTLIVSFVFHLVGLK